MEVVCDVAARRREARDHRCARRDVGEVVERQLHAALARDREQVEDAVRRAAGRGDPRHRVQQRAPVEERAGGGERAGGERARAPGGRVFRLQVDRRHEPVARGRDAEALDGDGHRVRREVAGARARAGAGDELQRVELVAADQAALFGADRLPDVLDRDVARAGAHRAAVEDDRGLVEPGERHQRGGHGLVAADEAHERVEVVRVGHQLDRVGDHLARDERRAHARAFPATGCR